MIFRSKTSRKSERGNIFFTLFGAVAIVGMLGAAIMTTMRGPLSTMVEVNRRTKAEAQMSVASQLVLLEAASAVDNGDCDGDGFVEPLEFKDPGAQPAPTGGGHIPDAVASEKNDPWGTPYGYCVWDAGPVVDNAACDNDGNAGFSRLDGTADNDQTYTMIALISAGPDQVFNTTCAEGPPSLTKTGDDIVSEFSYQTASVASGGLWNLKSGDPTIAEIGKDLEVSGTAKFKDGIDLSDPAFSPSAQLRLGAASMMLPDETLLATCNLANVNLLRINTVTDPDSVEICDDASDTGAGAFAWQSVAAGATGVGLWKNDGVGGPTEIYYSAGNVGIGTNDPDDPLDVVGNVGLTGNVELTANASVVWATGADITESGGNLQIDAGGANGVEITVANDNVAVNANSVITGSTTGVTTVDGLIVEDSAGANILIVQNDGKVGIGVDDPNDALDVSGNADISGHYKMDGTNILTDNSAADTILVGKGAGATVTGVRNTIVGAGAGATLTDGEDNILIGNVDITAASKDYYMNIGDVIHGDLTGKRVGIAFSDTYDVALFDDQLEVNGSIDASTNINADADITAGDDITATGDISGTDISASSQIFVGGEQLGPPAECTSTEKLEWDNASGWACVTDLQGGTGGGAADLDDVLGNGNDAGGLDAENFDQLGADEICNEDLSVCFDPANIGGSVTIALDNLTDAETDYATDHNMWLGSGAGGAILAGGQHNLAIGETAGDAITTGDRNIALGFGVLTTGATHTDNIGIGYNALTLTQDGGLSNIAIGSGALDANTTGDANIAIGTNALGANTASGGQVAIGYEALLSSAAGINNTAVGYQALRATDGNNNTALGFAALDTDTTGSANVGVGMDALGANTDGSGSVAVGYGALAALTTGGTQNTALGYQAGNSITTGDRNILIGYDVDTPTATTDEYLNIGGILFGDIGITSTDPRIGAYTYCDETLTTCFTAADVGSASAPRLNAIIAANNNTTIANAANNIVWNWELAAAETGFTFGETNASAGGASDQYILAAKTLALSTAIPFYIQNLGAGRSFQVDDVAADTSPFVISDTGAVGIGSAAPEALLEIQGEEASDATLAMDADEGDDAADTWFVKSLAASNALSILNDTSERVRLSSTGSLGLGDFSADTIDSALHIQTGDIRLDGGAANQAGCIRFDDTTDKIQFSHDCSTFTDMAGGTTSLSLSSITAAAADNTIANAAHNQIWNWTLAAAETGITFGETAASAGGSDDQYIVAMKTLATSTAMPLWIENAGAGLTLLIDDDATDTTPFVIDEDGLVGIGTLAPEALLEIEGTEAADATLALDADEGDDAADTWFIKSLATGNSLSFVNDATEVAALSSGGNLQIDGDLTISGDDLVMATNTSGFVLVADGTNFNPVAMSGDVTINSTGATAIGADKITEPMLKSVNAVTDEYCLTAETTTGDFEWQPCVGSGATIALSSITAATAANAITANNDFAQAWKWTLTTAGKSGMEFGEQAAATNGVGAQSVVKMSTLAASTAMPLWISNAGAANSFQVDDVAADTTPFVIDSNGAVLIGAATANSAMNKLYVAATDTGTAGADLFMHESRVTVEPSADQVLGVAGRKITAASAWANVPATSANHVNEIYGFQGIAQNDGTGDFEMLYGLNGWAYNTENVAGDMVVGAWMGAQSDDGTINAVKATEIWAGVYGGTTTVLTGMGITDLENTGGTVTNRYGIHIASFTGAATNDYGLYQAGTGQANYFAGNVGIGAPAPGAKLTVGNGATSAGVIRINEDTDDGANYASFTVPALAANTAYTLPPDDGTANQFLQTDGNGVLTWAAAGSTAANVPLSGITAATAANTITANDDYAQAWKWTLTTAAKSGMEFGEQAAATNGVAAQSVVKMSTLAASTAMPLWISNVGAANSFQVDDASGDTTPFVIDAAGNVGIGTNAPSYPLDMTVGVVTIGQRIYRNGAPSSVSTLLLEDGNTVSDSSLRFRTGAVSFTIGQFGNNDTFQISPAATLNGAGLNMNTSGYIGLLTQTPSYLLSFNGNAARTIGMERHTTADTAGNALTVLAGGATAAATDKNGGDLILSGGISTGTGDSDVYIKGYQNGAQATILTLGGNSLSTTTAGALTSTGLITGNANLYVGNGATSAGVIRINEDTDDGAHYASFTVPALAANTAYTLPPDDGTANQFLQTDGNGVLTWAAAGSTAANVPLSGITAATAANTITANDDYAQAWKWTLTTAAKSGMEFGEQAAATNGVAAQSVVKMSTLAASTAMPLWIVNEGAALSLLIEDVASDTTPFVIDAAGKVGIGTATPSFDVAFEGANAHSIGIENNGSSAGKALTIQAGDATGGTDINGGSLILQSGQSTGSSGSQILLKTPTIGASGTTLHAPTTKLTIGTGNVLGVTIAGTYSIDTAGVSRLNNVLIGSPGASTIVGSTGSGGSIDLQNAATAAFTMTSRNATTAADVFVMNARPNAAENLFALQKAGVAQITVDNSGHMGIADTTPNTGTGGALFLDVEGPIGGTKYCDENGDNCFTAASVAGGATVAWDAIGDAAGTGSVSFAGFDQDIVSSEDGGDILTITNTDADQAADSIVLRLATNDTNDVNSIFIQGTSDEDGTPATEWSVAMTGTAGGLTQTLGSSGVKITTDGDGAITFLSLGNGSGGAEDLTVNLDDTANEIDVTSSTGVTDIDFNTIDLNTDTLDLTGTGTINGLDAIDATGEATLEAALDIGGEVTSTGMGSTVIGDSIAVTSWNITTPIFSGKINADGSAVSDDDCTGEQGLYWYDDTDGAFEFCNANAGAPTVLGGATAANVPLSGITAATAANTITANDDYAQAWKWTLTTAAKSGMEFGEQAAGTNGTGAQNIVKISTLANSTATPLRIDNLGNVPMAIVANSIAAGTNYFGVEHSTATPVYLGGVINAIGPGNDTNGAFHAGLTSTTNSKNMYALVGMRRVNSLWSTAASALANGDYLPGIGFAGQTNATQTSGMRIGASILGVVDNTVSSNVLPSALVFHTSATDSTALTERLRISSAGLVGIGSTVPEALLEVQGAEATDAVVALDADDGDDAADTWFIKSLATGNSLSLVNDATEVAALSSGGNLQIDGDLTISGDDLVMATNTTGHILVADGTNFNPVAMSGDATIANTGALTIGADKILESHLKAVDAAGDEECLTYETTTGDFEWQACGGTAVNVPLSGITAATAANTITANNDYAQAWKWTLTTAAKSGMEFGEQAAATNGVAAQSVVKMSTLAASTAMPLWISNAGAALSLRVDDASGDTTPFVIDAAGSVGIGTATPGAPLHLYKSSGFSYMAIENDGTTSSDGVGLTMDRGATASYGNIDFATNGTLVMAAGLNAGDATNGFSIWDSDAGGNPVRFFIGGTTGNVGIGSTVPEALLEVQGAEATDAVVALDADDGDDAADTWFIKSLASGNSLSFLNDATAYMGLNATTKLVVTPPSTETIAAAGTITANACGSIKPIDAGSSVTTNTTDTFTTPAAGYNGCCMDVVNVDSADTITLDVNANFITASGSNVALAPGDITRVCATATTWYQTEDKGSGTPAGSTTQLQYNNSGAFGGTNKLVWDSVNERLGLGLAGAPGYKFDVYGCCVAAVASIETGTDDIYPILRLGNTSGAKAVLGFNTYRGNEYAVGVSANVFIINPGRTIGLNPGVAINSSGSFGIGTTAPSYLLSMGGNAARTIGMERHTTADTAGNALTVLAGGATAAATDKNGGDLILSGGISTGTGDSDVYIKGYQNGAQATILTMAGNSLATTTAGALTSTGLVTGNANLYVGNGATSAGTIRINEDTDDGANYASFSVPALAADTVYTLPPDDGASGQQLTTDGSGVLTWAAAGSGGGGSLDAITAAVANQAGIANGAYTIVWNWDALTNGSAMKFATSGTTATNGQKMLEISLTGANATGGATTYGTYITNTHSGGTSTNVGLYASASGGTTANYAAIFAAGNVGIGTTAPSYLLSLDGDTAAQTIGMERETTAATAGRALTVQAGGAVSGGSNKNGGDLNLYGGVSTGSGTSNIAFYGYDGSQGTATSDNTAVQILKLTGKGTTILGLGGDTCAAGTAGGIRYAGGAIQYCNGTAWANIDSSVLTPAGADTQIQFNDSTVFAGDADFTWDKTGNTLTVNGTVSAATKISLGLIAGANAPTGGMAIDDVSDVALVSATNGECLVYNGTNWVDGSCGGAGSVALNGITDAAGNGTLDNTDYNMVWNWQLSGAEAAMTFGENVASTGGSSNQYILQASTLAASTAIPLYVNNLGAGRSFQVDDVAADTTPFLIDASGNVGIGQATPAKKLHVEDGQASSYVAYFYNTDVSGTAGDGIAIRVGSSGNMGSGNDFIQLQRSDGTVIGQIEGSNNTTTAYTTTSDRRLKEHIRDTHLGIDDLMKVHVRDYNFISDPANDMTGFIAQELYDIYPGAVSKPQDETKENWGIDYGLITPLIVKSVQDVYDISMKLEKDNIILKAEIESLRVKIGDKTYDKVIAPLTKAVENMKAENASLKIQLETMKMQHDEMKAMLKNVTSDVKGLKAHTGYGIRKAGFEVWQIAAILAFFGCSSAFFFFFLGGSLRRHWNRKN